MEHPSRLRAPGATRGLALAALAAVTACGASPRATSAPAVAVTTGSGARGTLRTLWVGRGARPADGVERVSRHPRGLEQTWTFDRAPPGRGALRVWVGVDGVRYVGVDDRGLRFADAAGGALRYGHATWVDAQGARTAVPASWNGSAIELSVPEQVLAASAWPAVLDPVVGPEFPLDPTPDAVPGSTRVTETVARVVRMGAGGLAVWADTRSGQRVMARTVDATGAPQGSAVVIDQQAGRTLSDVVAASDGTNALAAWVSVEGAQRVVRVRRVGAAGALDATSTEVGRVASSSARLAIAGDPTGGWLLVWGELATGVAAVRIARDGRVLDAAPIAVFAGRLVEGAVSVAASAGGYLVTWADGSISMTRYARVSRDGAVLDPGGAAVAATARTRQGPAVGSDGAGFLLTWYDTTAGGSLQPGLYGMRIGAAGPLDAAPIRLGAEQSSGARSVLFDGTDYAVVSMGSPLQLRRVTPGGVVRDVTPRQVPLPAGTTGVSLAATGARYVAALSVSSTVMAQAIGFDGATSGAPRPVVALATAQLSPAVASDGRGFLATWSVGSAGYRLARVSPAGVVLDAPPRALTQGSEWLASSGTNYLMAWGAVDGLAMPIGLDGTASAPRPLWDGDFRPRSIVDITGGPGGYAVVTYGQSTTVSFGLDYFRVSSAGEAVPGASRTLVSVDGMHAASVFSAVGASRTAYAAAQQLEVSESLLMNFCYVTLTRMTPEGDALDRGIRLLRAPAPCARGAMEVASDGSDFLVIWPAAGATTGADLVMARVEGTSGTVLDATPLPLVTAPGAQSNPSAAFDGTDYVVTWSDQRGGNADIYVARVSQAGVVRDPGGVPAVAEPEAVGAPRLASTGAGRSLVVYARGDVDGVSRAYGRILDFSDGGVLVDAGAADAATGTDASGIDVVVRDGAVMDLGAVDTGPGRDGSTATDGAMVADAGVDAGVMDAGGRDAAPDASGSDAVVAEAGGGADGGAAADAALSPPDDSGCSVGGAAGARGTGAPVSLALLAVGLLVRRRRGVA